MLSSKHQLRTRGILLSVNCHIVQNMILVVFLIEQERQKAIEHFWQESV